RERLKPSRATARLRRSRAPSGAARPSHATRLQPSGQEQNEKNQYDQATGSVKHDVSSLLKDAPGVYRPRSKVRTFWRRWRTSSQFTTFQKAFTQSAFTL